jgi:hypothetical protein
MYLPWATKHRLLWLLLCKPFRVCKKQVMGMENSIDVETDFRNRYRAELQKMTDKRLADERIQVNQQGMRTPSRRGETLKHEEISAEWIRRLQKHT